MPDKNLDTSPLPPILRGSISTDPIDHHDTPHSERGLILLSKSLDAVIIISVLIGAVITYRSVWDSKYSTAALVAAIVFR